MATVALSYASAATITMTLNPAGVGLANGASRESSSVDNSSDLYVDALVGGIVQVGAIAADNTIEIYAYGSYDGTNYMAGLTGSDGTVTWGTTGNTGDNGLLDLPLLGVISVDPNDDNTDMRWGPYSVAQAFGGVLPQKWGIVFVNRTGAALNSTGSNNVTKFTGVKYTVI